MPSTGTTARHFGGLLAMYRISDMATVGSVNYYGFLSTNGQWYIMEEDSVANTFRYIRGITGYDTAWANHPDLTYELFNEVF